MGEQRERRLIAEWARERFPTERKMFNVPLGSEHEELDEVYKQIRGLNSWHPWRLKADCVVVTGSCLIIAEAKIFQLKSAIGDLLIYKGLITSTPELQHYLPRIIELRAVMPWLNPSIQELGTSSGVVIDVFSPPWIRDYVEEHGKYHTRPYMTKRLEKQRVIKSLGLE